MSTIVGMPVPAPSQDARAVVTGAVVGLIVIATVCLLPPQPLCQIIVAAIAALNHRRRIPLPPTKPDLPLHMLRLPHPVA